MFELKTFDFVTGLQISTIQVVNMEFYAGLLIGALAALTVWICLKGVV